MNKSIRWMAAAGVLTAVLSGCSPSPKQQALESITAMDLKHHLDILAADEFRGRDTPSRSSRSPPAIWQSWRNATA